MERDAKAQSSEFSKSSKRSPLEAEPREDVEERWSAAMGAAQAGDTEAYHRLLEEIVPAIRRQVRAKLFDPAAVEDVVQNALLSLHRARHTYRPERPFGPWMRTISRNAVIDHLRERKRRVEREVAVELMDQFQHPRATAEPEQDALDPRLRQALEALPSKQREAVELIQLRGLSVAEAALRAGVTPGALKVRAHRGYRALRALLEGRQP